MKPLNRSESNPAIPIEGKQIASPATDHLAQVRTAQVERALGLQGAVRAAVHDVAVALLPDLENLGSTMAERLFAVMPEVRHTGADELVRSSCQANSALVLEALVRGVPVHMAAPPSAEVMHLTRAMVQHGLSWMAVMRGYRLAAQYFIEHWADAVLRHKPGDPQAVEATKAVTSFVLAWLDGIIDGLANEYRDEEERVARERSLARVEDVQHVLTDPDVNVDSASARLGYRLSGRHVAVVLRACTDKPEAGNILATAVRELIQAIGTGRGLTVRVDMRTSWCWLTAPAEPIRMLRPPTTPVFIAMSGPAVGLDGFRRSHREALDALRVAEIAGRPAATVTYYRDVDIAAMCSVDADRCRQFIHAKLGALAGDDPASQRQRETLIAFYGANCNYRATAANLGIHHNTVRYRLEQAGRVLGHGLEDRRLAMELALHLNTVIGTAVNTST